MEYTIITKKVVVIFKKIKEVRNEK